MLLVGERCFEGCPNIREIHSESINPPVISENAFNDIYDFAKLYVPVGLQKNMPNLIYVGVDADSLKLPTGTYIVKEQNKTKKIIVK